MYHHNVTHRRHKNHTIIHLLALDYGNFKKVSTMAEQHGIFSYKKIFFNQLIIY